VDEATIRERAVNFYVKEKEEAMTKKLEQQRKYREELDRQKEAREGLRWQGKMT